MDMENEDVSSQQSSKGNNLPIIIIVIIILALVLGGGAYYMSQKSSKMTQTSVVPTQTPAVSPSEAMTQQSTQSAQQESATKTFEIDGSNFKFSPNAISVKEGDTVQITFKNTQGFHNFMLDEFNAKSKTIPSGDKDILTFVANKRGSFQFYCGVGNHRAMGMVGTLTVE